MSEPSQAVALAKKDTYRLILTFEFGGEIRSRRRTDLEFSPDTDFFSMDRNEVSIPFVGP